MIHFSNDPLGRYEYIAVLVHRLFDRSPYSLEWWDAERELEQVGPLAVPDLIKLLDPKNPEYVLNAAAQCLGENGSLARHAASALMPLISHPKPLVRNSVLIALHKINANLKFGLPLILERLQQEPAPGLRGELYRLIERIGPSAGNARPYLLLALTDDWNFENAVLALRAIRPNDPELVRLLLQSLNHPDRRIRRAAVRSLGKMRVQSPEVFESIHKLSMSSDPQLRHESRQALARISKQPKRQKPRWKKS